MVSCRKFCVKIFALFCMLVFLLTSVASPDSSFRIFIRTKAFLKVDGNEKLGGPKRRQQLNFSPALWRSRVILNLNVSFLCKTQIFPFPLATAF